MEGKGRVRRKGKKKQGGRVGRGRRMMRRGNVKRSGKGGEGRCWEGERCGGEDEGRWSVRNHIS